MLEVSVVVFLLQGYLTSGREVSSESCASSKLCTLQEWQRRDTRSNLLPWAEHTTLMGSLKEKDAVIGLQALVRTLWMSGAYAAFENLVSMGYIFGAQVPLFLFWCAPAVLSRCIV